MELFSLAGPWLTPPRSVRAAHHDVIPAKAGTQVTCKHE